MSSSSCWNNRPLLTVVIGGVQLLLSQMKNLQAARISSAVGGLAAICYCVITLVLAASQVSDVICRDASCIATAVGGLAAICELCHNTGAGG
jgi:hypothetical protein